jgi:DNA-binding MarR family transcriptional regulator
MTRKQEQAERPAEAPKPRTRRRGRLAPLSRRQADELDWGGLDEIIGFMVRRAQASAFEDFRYCAGDIDLTPVQFAALRLVHANPGINQTTLANALGAEAPRMVIIIDRLERQGLLTRLASTVDRRSRVIFLTPEGRALHKAISKRVEVQNRRMIERLAGEDPQALLRMLRKLATPV